MVLALVMTRQSSGGVRIGVEAVTRVGPELRVRYRVSRPAPGGPTFYLFII